MGIVGESGGAVGGGRETNWSTNIIYVAVFSFTAFCMATVLVVWFLLCVLIVIVRVG